MTTPPDTIDLREICTWAREAGDIARSHFNHVTPEHKPDTSPVTVADRTIEQYLVSRIANKYPSHGILGEEQTSRSGDGIHLWAIDPIDGTAAFVAGLPLWCIAIGLLHHNRPVLGVVYVPLTDDLYTAAPGEPACLNGQPINTRPPGPPTPIDWLAVPSDVHRYQITLRTKMRSAGSTAAAICYVARGGAIGALVTQSSLWDLAAPLAILAAAGGSAEYLNGQPLDLAALSAGDALSGPAIFAHPERLTQLRTNIQR